MGLSSSVVAVPVTRQDSLPPFPCLYLCSHAWEISSSLSLSLLHRMVLTVIHYVATGISLSCSMVCSIVTITTLLTFM